ncbi:MAG: type II toxin-antitoxin system RelE/ParE family toxin [Ruminococcaceae bacterium]|nr:type II toxin-antitoxin system RelE/ParE family toxin [Oscillospiraceae bacterium]
MKYKVVLTSTAARDLDEIFAYIAEVLCEKEIAVNMINLLQKNILSLDEMPGRCKLYENEPWKSCGMHMMRVKNYLVFYTIDEESKTVNIIRVLYGSRDLDAALE